MSADTREPGVFSSDLWMQRVPEPEIELEGADEYSDLADRVFRESDKAFAEELASKIPQRSHVADIGSGPGSQATFLALLRPDLRIHLVDYSEDMLALAEKRAGENGVLSQFLFHQGDMRRLQFLMGSTSTFVYSNTAIHELRGGEEDLTATLRGIEWIAGGNGIYLRDLVRPQNAKEAAGWRAEVVRDEDLGDRGRQLFTNSQRAGFSLHEWRRAVNSTQLSGRAAVFQPSSPNSRYVIVEAPPLAIA